MFYYLLICLFVISPTAGFCDQLNFLEPEHVSIDYINYKQGGIEDWYPARTGLRDAYLDPLDDEMIFGLGINMDYNLIRHQGYKVFHRNDWSFDSAKSHVRHVKWKFELGLSIYNKIEIYHQHVSRHVLEDTRDIRFPVRDTLNLRLVIFQK